MREVPRRAPQGCLTNKIVQVNGVSVYSSAVSCIEQKEVFCARDDEGRQIVVFVDDGSEVTLLKRSMVLKHWARSKGELINITGIGADKVGTGAAVMVAIPIRFRSYMDVTMLTCYVVPDEVLPCGVDVLVGKPDIKDMGIRPDSKNMRMEFSELRNTTGIPLVVNTMPLEKQLDILDAPPMRVLDICGGGSFSYQTLRDMGYDFDVYDSIEKDGNA